MKKYFLLLLVLALYSNTYSQELRATWLSRNELTSRSQIAKIMDSLANNNFNTVYVNVWSRGYPLWKSELFQKETGTLDPNYTNRDVLEEAIIEGHRVGLHVEAWFEYGFVGGYTGYYPGSTGKGPIFTNHPDWVSKTNTGVEKDGSNFYWMIHTKPEVQDFLINMVMEVCRNYDVDGVELDRIRYSSLQYGYDDYTLSLYQQETGKTNPGPNDASFIRWRADNLNQFMKRNYDSIKTVSKHINVSNAPSLYGYNYTSYNSFAQDWMWWVDSNAVDNVQVQSYVQPSSYFGNLIDVMKSMVDNDQKLFPAFGLNINGGWLTNMSDIPNYVTITRNKGLGGNSIWYYGDLVGNFHYLKSVYQNKTYPPYSYKNWREFRSFVHHTNNDVVKTGTWTNSSLPGTSGGSLYSKKNSNSTITFNADVKVPGYYDVYFFNIIASQYTSNAHVYVVNNDSTYLNLLNQNTGTTSWKKLGTYYYSPGVQPFIRVTTEGGDTTLNVRVDAAFMKLNRKLSPDSTLSVVNDEPKEIPQSYNFDLKNYPNPFNGQTKLNFHLNNLDAYSIKIFNILGELIYTHNRIPDKVGVQEVELHLENQIGSGIYLVNLTQNLKQETKKIILTK